MVGHKVLSGESHFVREEGALNCMKAPLSFFPSCKTTLALELRCWSFPRVLLKPFLQTEQGKVVEDAARRTGIRENLPFAGGAQERKPSSQCGPLYLTSPGFDHFSYPVFSCIHKFGIDHFFLPRLTQALLVLYSKLPRTLSA